MYYIVDKKLFIGIMLFLVLSTVMSSCTSSNDCFVADTIQVVSNVKKDGIDYFLVIRTTGFSDKVSFIELYSDKMPEFDSCGKTDSKILDQKYMDSGAGFLEKVKADNGKLEIVYTSDKKESLAPEMVVFEVQ